MPSGPGCHPSRQPAQAARGGPMPRLLILYGTTDGHTAKIADFLAGALRSLGGFVDVVDAGAASPDPRGYDGVIVAASLHARGYQRSVSRWVGAHHPALRGRPSIFVSVCLSVLQKEPEVHGDLAAIVRHFEAATGWHPRQVKHVAGGPLYTRDGWQIGRAACRGKGESSGGA